MNNVVRNRTISRMFATLHNDNTSIKSRKHLQTKSYVQIQLLMANLLTTLDRSDPGGGTRDIYWWGCALAHQKRGGLRCGHSPKRGVLGAGTAQKKGGLRCGHNQKKGGLRHVYNPKKGEFRTDLVRSCSKGGLGSLFMYYLYFYLTLTI